MKKVKKVTFSGAVVKRNVLYLMNNHSFQAKRNVSKGFRKRKQY